MFTSTLCTRHRSILVILKGKSQSQQVVAEHCCWIQRRQLPVDRKMLSGKSHSACRQLCQSARHIHKRTCLYMYICQAVTYTHELSCALCHQEALCTTLEQGEAMRLCSQLLQFQSFLDWRACRHQHRPLHPDTADLKEPVSRAHAFTVITILIGLQAACNALQGLAAHSLRLCSLDCALLAP